MKKRTATRYFIIVLIFLVLGILLSLTDTFFGNPVTYAIVKWRAERYIAENYSDKNLELGELQFNGGSTGCYSLRVQSDWPEDEHFTLYFDRRGSLVFDSYVQDVFTLRNTYNRMNRDFIEDVWAALEDCSFTIAKDESTITIGEYRRVLPYLNMYSPYYPKEDEALRERYVSLWCEVDEASWEIVDSIILETQQLLDRRGIYVEEIHVMLLDPEDSLYHGNATWDMLTWNMYTEDWEPTIIHSIG